MFNFVNTKKEKQWLSLTFLRSNNIDGRGGLRVIDVEKYIEEAMPKIKEIDLKVCDNQEDIRSSNSKGE